MTRSRDALPRIGPRTRARLQRLLIVYAIVVCLAILLQVAADARVQAFGLGLAFPGAGFLRWIGADGSQSGLALLLMLGAAGSFALALVVWFGTGNILLPPVTWLASAFAAAGAGPWLGVDGSREGQSLLAIGILAFLALAILAALLALSRLPERSPQDLVAVADPEAMRASPIPAARPPELDVDTLGLLSLVLDRAQQPVDAFNGFEWRDQFQTAAIRYQLNFLSYALSMVQANHLPASGDYLAAAHGNLLAKLGDHRVWRYWALESAWGRLRLASDPVPVDNIMYTGFAAAQIVFAQNAGTGVGALQLRHPRGDRERYPIERLVALLTAQYRTAPFGLLACEPNWIYPLCNAITLAAIKGHDARSGRADWPTIAQQFRNGLVTEFTTGKGDIVPFRSSVTGLAPPAMGGAVMQAFPSFFLNSLLPDIAAMQWERLRATLAGKHLASALWPIDVGNYGFSRASSYAASAAAAVEMGDGEIAGQLLSALDAECPAVTSGGARHRLRASLWAHALELTARAGCRDGLRRLVTDPSALTTGPHLREIRHPDILIARAVAAEGRLDATLYPGRIAGPVRVRLGGLVPGGAYHARGAQAASFRSDATGCAELGIVLDDRTEMSVLPAA